MSAIQVPSTVTLPSSHLKTMDDYYAMYKESIDNPKKFWKKVWLAASTV